MRAIMYERNTQQKEYEITIESNPDHWRGGFVWSVSFGDEEVGCGLEFSHRLAARSANQFINSKNENMIDAK